MSYQLIKSDSTVCPVKVPETDGKSQAVEAPRQKISKKQLVNKLNYLNFQHESILINFKHKKYGQTFTCPATPQPCLGEEVICTWVDPSAIKAKLHTYAFESILLKERQSNLEIRLELLELTEEHIHFKIPEIYYQYISKKSLREPCQGVRVQMIQNSVVFMGDLIDFNASEFNVTIKLEPPQTSQWINPDESVNILLMREKESIYSGKCKIVKEKSNSNTVEILLESTSQNIHRFRKKKFRSTREKISPTPIIRFQHPFTKKLHEYNVIDVSGSGFSIEKTHNSPALIPGMLLPEVTMRFANGLKIKFKAQVIYFKDSDHKKSEETYKYGIGIVDIDLNQHENLMGLLHQINDKNAFLSSEIDLDSLWDFFFESGFIYPKKYKYIYKLKTEISKTYDILYAQNPEIARHFICKEEDLVQAHMSSIRFYENAWIIHHHAARRSSFKTGGISVLNQIGRFINDSHRLFSAKMDYVFCYFRDTNKFPNRVFGGAARRINNPKACSLDSFAYLHAEKTKSFDTPIPFAWELKDCKLEDVEELKLFYEFNTAGLMLDALDLTPQTYTSNTLSNVYKKNGLQRERTLYSLKKDNFLKAIIMVNIANKGINLSELTNSISIFILDPVELHFNILNTIIAFISKNSNLAETPILIHPIDYLTNEQIEYERIYNLWILNTYNTDDYFSYLKRLLKFIQH